MEAGSDLEQGAHSPKYRSLSRRRLGYSRQNFQKSALSSTVLSYDAEDLAVSHLEGHRPKRPEFVSSTLGAEAGPERFAPSHKGFARISI
jgi:hypothetical protein